MKKVTYNPITAESRQRKLIDLIRDNWKKIQMFNISEANTDVIRPFDIMALYNEIISFENELIQIKLIRQFWNAGSKDFNEFKRTSIHEDIFKLQQYKERLQKLVTLPQLTKADKFRTIIIDTKFINEEKKILTKLIDSANKNLTEFNNNLSFEIAI